MENRRHTRRRRYAAKSRGSGKRETKKIKDMEYSFNAEKVAQDLVAWVQEWFAANGPKANAVIGMSGGKDSTVCAAVLCKALGADRVIGVSMPDGSQGLNEAQEICDHLGMKMLTINIGGPTAAMNRALEEFGGFEISKQTAQNIPPRIRMTTLYAVAQSMNGRVINTCNASEDYIGYSTKFGDAAGDVSLLANLTVSEVLAVGDYLGVPYKWVHKTPDDGLPHSSPDEVKLGFTYAELDRYIREGIVPSGYVHDNEAEGLKVTKIDNLHRWNLHKIQLMPAFRW